MNHIPQDILIEIFLFLNHQELLKISNTCTDWNKVSKNETIWKELCFRRKFTKLNNKNFKGTFIYEMEHYYKWNELELITHPLDKHVISFTKDMLTFKQDSNMNLMTYWKILLALPFWIERDVEYFGFHIEKMNLFYGLKFGIYDYYTKEMIHSYHLLFNENICGIVKDNQKRSVSIYVNGNLVEKETLQQSSITYFFISFAQGNQISIIKGWRP